MLLQPVLLLPTAHVLLKQLTVQQATLHEPLHVLIVAPQLVGGLQVQPPTKPSFHFKLRHALVQQLLALQHAVQQHALDCQLVLATRRASKHHPVDPLLVQLAPRRARPCGQARQQLPALREVPLLHGDGLPRLQLQVRVVAPPGGRAALPRGQVLRLVPIRYEPTQPRGEQLLELERGLVHRHELARE